MKTFLFNFNVGGWNVQNKKLSLSIETCKIELSEMYPGYTVYFNYVKELNYSILNSDLFTKKI